jgi:IS5 family transposase
MPITPKTGSLFHADSHSRGGFSTDLDGYPIGFHLTGGEASDSRNFEVLLDLGPNVDPRAVVADKGYDAKTNREAARKRGICPVNPYRSRTPSPSRSSSQKSSTKRGRESSK